MSFRGVFARALILLFTYSSNICLLSTHHGGPAQDAEQSVVSKLANPAFSWKLYSSRERQVCK